MKTISGYILELRLLNPDGTPEVWDEPEIFGPFESPAQATKWWDEHASPVYPTPSLMTVRPLCTPQYAVTTRGTPQ